jgi:hypothetical protein
MNARCLLLFSLTVALFVACTGCRHPWLNSTYNPGIAQAPTFPCSVSLSLGQEFTNNLDTPREILAPLVPVLQKYAIYVAQSTFGDVQVLDGQPQRSDVKLLLVPHVTSAMIQSEPPGSGAIGIHWNFKDPKTGQTLFSTQVQCEYVHPIRFFPGPVPLSDVVDHMMTNLTSITIQRFDASKDLQRFIGH